MPNGVDPNQTPHISESDLELHCFPCPINGALGINGIKSETYLEAGSLRI